VAGKMGHMVRPERRVVLAGGKPVRVSAGAPGSRLQPGGEIRPSRAECRKPWRERGANRRAATISERNSLVIFSAERCLRGPSRSCHGEGNRQHPGTERVLDLSGVAGGGTSGWRATRNRRDPTWQPSQAKTGRIKPDGGKRAEPGGIPRGPKYRGRHAR
jgi:hypothetical protein